MHQENEFIEKFNQAVLSTGLYTDRQSLVEEDKGVPPTDNRLFELIPIVSQILSSHRDYSDRQSQWEVDQKRLIFSNKLLKIASELKPSYFSSVEEAQKWEECLYYNYPHFVHANAEVQGQIHNWCEEARVYWVSASHKEAKVDRAKIHAEVEEVFAAQKKYFAAQEKFFQQSRSEFQKFHEKLDRLQAEQSQGHAVLSDNGKQLQKKLDQYEIHLDENTLLLLQADMQLAEQLENVIAYLAASAASQQEQVSRQNTEALYTGAMRGFELLGAIGRFTKNSYLEKFAVVGSSSVQIYMAVQQMSQFAGLAVLNPVSTIGMALFNIAGLFFKPGPDPYQMIFKQLRQISVQINKLHVFIHDEFKGVSYQLYRLQEVIDHRFQQIQYLVKVPVMRRLEDIQHDLHALANLVHEGFQDVLLSQFQESITEADSIERGIITAEMLSPENIVKKLVFFVHWIKETSYNRHFTAMLLMRDERLQWRISPQHTVMAFETLKDSREIVPLLLMLAHQEQWITSSNNRLPHTGIWLKAVRAYLMLRIKFRDKLKDVYDRDSKEIVEMIALCRQHLEDAEGLVSSQQPLVSINRHLVRLFTVLQHGYDTFRSAEMSSHQQNSPLGRARLNLLATLDEKTVSSLMTDNIPKQFSFEYVPGEDKGRRLKRQKEFTRENGFTQEDCLKLIAQAAVSQQATLFDPFLLLAEKAGLIEFQFKMHRSMSNGAQQVYQTEGGLYGLETILYIRSSQERIQLTKAKLGYAKWESARHRTTQVTINSHKRELPKYTVLMPEPIRDAVTKVRRLIEERFNIEKQGFYQRLSAMLLDAGQPVQKIMLNLGLAQIYLSHSQFKIKLTHDYSDLLNTMQRLSNALGAPDSPVQWDAIGAVFAAVPSFIQELTNTSLSMQPAHEVFVGCIQDLYLGLRLFHKFHLDNRTQMESEFQEFKEPDGVSKSLDLSAPISPQHQSPSSKQSIWPFNRKYSRHGRSLLEVDHKSNDSLVLYQRPSQFKSVLFDAGQWDSDISQHPDTHAPIFTYRVFKVGDEVGSAQFYGHPLLCRSADGSRHNLLELKGVLTQFDPQQVLANIEDVCTDLPPTPYEQIQSTMIASAKHGAIRGVANIVEQAMENKGFSNKLAKTASESFYYLGMFAANTLSYYVQDNRLEDDWSKLSEAAVQSATDTAFLFFSNTLLKTACRASQWLGSQSEQSGWKKSASVFNAVVQYGGYSIFAYDSVTRGTARAAVSIVTGAAVQTIVEQTGARVLAN